MRRECRLPMVYNVGYAHARRRQRHCAPGQGCRARTTRHRPPRRLRLCSRAHARRPISSRSSRAPTIVEPDLVMTRMACSIARHENEIGATTNVADHPNLPPAAKPRSSTARRSKDGSPRILPSRSSRRCAPASASPTCGRTTCASMASLRFRRFEEILALVRGGARAERRVRAQRLRAGRRRRQSVSTRRPSIPSYFQSRACDGGGRSSLRSSAGTSRCRCAGLPAVVRGRQFEALRGMTRPADRAARGGECGQPFDFKLSGDARTLCRTHDARGPGRNRRLRAGHRRRQERSSFRAMPMSRSPRRRRSSADAHAPAAARCTAGRFAPRTLFCRASCARAARAHGAAISAAEVDAYLAAGMDGFFTDQPDLGVRARDAFVATR